MKRPISGRGLRWMLLALGLAVAVRHWVWMPTLIISESMQPTLHSGQLAGINKLAYRSNPPRRGDIVTFWNGQGLMVKRVVGLPGEEFATRDGVIYVNGRPLAEPYIRFGGGATIAPGRLGPNRFVMAGDYRLGSEIAVVSRDRIVGHLMSWREGDAKPGR